MRTLTSLSPAQNQGYNAHEPTSLTSKKVTQQDFSSHTDQTTFDYEQACISSVHKSSQSVVDIMKSCDRKPSEMFVYPNSRSQARASPQCMRSIGIVTR